MAVVELPNTRHTNSLVQGFIPTDWYPGAVVADSNYVYAANVKGLGSRAGQPATSLLANRLRSWAQRTESPSRTQTH